jgi:hypothetical protein
LTQAEAVTRQRDIEVSRIWVYLLGFVGFLAFPLLTLSMSPGGWSYGAVLGFLGLEGAVLVGLIRAESPRRRLRRKPIGDPRSQKPPAKSAPFSMASKSKA